jgi:hypothetical protein
VTRAQRLDRLGAAIGMARRAPADPGDFDLVELANLVEEYFAAQYRFKHGADFEAAASARAFALAEQELRTVLARSRQLPAAPAGDPDWQRKTHERIDHEESRAGWLRRLWRWLSW